MPDYPVSHYYEHLHILDRKSIHCCRLEVPTHGIHSCHNHSNNISNTNIINNMKSQIAMMTNDFSKPSKAKKNNLDVKVTTLFETERHINNVTSVGFIDAVSLVPFSDY
ncbi:hypothetical protein BsWGS_01658 [Bradybaena similaris]